MRTNLVIGGSNLSDAWARTVIELAAEDKHRACHVITRVADPTCEDAGIREMAEGILADRGLDPVSTVANTLFPQEQSGALRLPWHEERWRRSATVVGCP